MSRPRARGVSRTRRLVALVAVVLMVAVSGCTGGRPEGNLDVPAKDALDTAQGVTKVTFWHSMDSSNGVALNALVDKFKGMGLTVTEVDKADFEKTVLEQQPVESFGYNLKDWEDIRAVQ